MKFKSDELQTFLDQGQYSRHGLEKYEWIFGETFLSTGGMETTKKVMKHVTIGRNTKVLDLGSGLGGHSFILAEVFGAEVIGLDLSANMMAIARRHLENRPHLKQQVTFEIQDYTQSIFPENTFDMIYSRDSFLHIQNKPELFNNIYKWLKPGGYVLFTDYTRGDDETKYTDEFKKYLQARNYHLATISEYKSILQNAGFKDVLAADWRKEFKEALDLELNKLRQNKVEFLKSFTQQDYDDLETGWTKKLERLSNNNQGWLLGAGRK